MAHNGREVYRTRRFGHASVFTIAPLRLVDDDDCGEGERSRKKAVFAIRVGRYGGGYYGVSLAVGMVVRVPERTGDLPEQAFDALEDASRVRGFICDSQTFRRRTVRGLLQHNSVVRVELNADGAAALFIDGARITAHGWYSNHGGAREVHSTGSVGYLPSMRMHGWAEGFGETGSFALVD